MIEFVGKVNGIVFENDQDMFKILDVEIKGNLPGYDRDEIKVTGNFGEIQIAASYQFEGDFRRHEKFGLQFNVSSYHQVLPHEEGSLVKYFSSSKFPGIGQKAAQTIVDELGLKALELLKKNPAKISTLSISRKQKDSLLSGINSIDSFSEIMLRFAQYGIKKKVATRLYSLYHGDAIKKLQEDPYQPISEVQGYAFKTADFIGRELGIGQTDPKRIAGAVCQVLNDALAANGDTYVGLAELLTEASKLLEMKQFDPIADEVNNLQKNGQIVVNGENAALANIYQTEMRISQLLEHLVKNRQQAKKYSDQEISDAISEVEHKSKIKYDPTQKQAIKNALNHPISILTGGPGTGKTTIINGILQALIKLAKIPASSLYSDDPPFLLAAPTGRAAKRMGEITGISAKTIHRMLGLGIGDSETSDLNELNGEILIIDEMSMVDMFLFKQLLQSINQTRHIVFVGDKDQLPSVGAGNVFADLIKSEVFPTTILKQIHRQKDDSSIVNLAHAINAGQDHEMLFQKTKNYSFIPCAANQVGQAVGQIVKLALKRGFEKDDIQVLAAMYHGNGGINNLNDILQDILNPAQAKSKSVSVHEEEFRIGDRILQLQNNPEKDIFNGQIGKVIGIEDKTSKNQLIANFDGREVEFNKKDMLDLTRAYAISIHKSQGSEFPLVVLNLTMQNYVMLKRNLLYTAITRAEKNLVLVGEKRAYEAAFSTPGNDRKTGLTKDLQTVLEKLPKSSQIQAKKNDEAVETQTSNEKVDKDNEEYILTKENIYSGEIDPMIGMTGVSLKAQGSNKLI